MIRLLPLLLLAPTLAAAQPRMVVDGAPVAWDHDGPVVYSYGDEIGPDLRSVVELALYRWEKATGVDLAEPYRPGDTERHVLITAADLNPDGPPDCDPLDAEGGWYCDDAGHLERVDFTTDAAAPWVILRAVLTLEASLSRAEAIGPALHGWGHIWGLEDCESARSVMTATPAGHMWPTIADVLVVREGVR